MFYGLENTQKDVSLLLENLINANEFPSSCLFSGPAYSGRMFAALSVAKAFGSDLDSTIIISDRNHSFRIAAALKLFRKAKNNSAKNFLYESVSTFLKQFHGALLDSQSPANRKKFENAGQCMDLLDELKKCDESSAEKIADKLEASLASLSVGKSVAANVNQIRDIRAWASTSSLDGKEKFIIIEGLENSSEGTVNALLKTLEEPPEDTHFILISSNPGRIPATILSRVRQFKFKPFSETEKNYVLNQLFVNPKDFSDLESFYLSYSGVDDNLLKDCACKLASNKAFDLPALAKELERTQAWERFYYLVVSSIVENYKAGIIKENICNYICDEINNAVSKGKAFNQTNRLTFDFVVFRTKEVLS